MSTTTGPEGEPKWKPLKGKYKRFIKEDKRGVVEKWYNKLSEPIQQKKFRYLVKRICQQDENEIPRSEMQAHKARIIYQHYAQNILHPAYRLQTLSWLFAGTNAQHEIFREVFTALDIAAKDIAPRTAAQEEYPHYEIPALSPEAYEEAKRRNNMTFMSQMTIVREVLRRKEQEISGENGEQKDSVEALLNKFDDVKQARGTAGFMKELLTAPNESALKNTVRIVSKADEKEKEHKSKLLNEEIKVLHPMSKVAPRGNAISLSHRPSTSSSDRVKTHPTVSIHTPSMLPSGFATTEDGFLVTGTWDNPMITKSDDVTFKSRRVQTPWNSTVGIKSAVDNAERGYLLSRPLRRTHDVKTPWLSYYNPGNTITQSLEVHRYIPHVVSEKYNNNTDQKNHQLACNPKNTASVGNMVPSPIVGME